MSRRILRSLMHRWAQLGSMVHVEKLPSIACVGAVLDSEEEQGVLDSKEELASQGWLTSSHPHVYTQAHNSHIFLHFYIFTFFIFTFFYIRKNVLGFYRKINNSAS